MTGGTSNRLGSALVVGIDIDRLFDSISSLSPKDLGVKSRMERSLQDCAAN